MPYPLKPSIKKANRKVDKAGKFDPDVTPVISSIIFLNIVFPERIREEANVEIGTHVSSRNRD